VGVAREEVTLLVDGAPQTLEIVRQERIHGQEAYWVCPRCGELRWHLYVHNSEVACRVCLGLSYACRHHNAAAIRARKLRRRLGSLPGLLEAEFLAESVTFADADHRWEQSFSTVTHHPSTLVLVMSEELGPAPDGVSVHDRCNRWILYSALSIPRSRMG
jgi:hypothetical protein